MGVPGLQCDGQFNAKVIFNYSFIVRDANNVDVTNLLSLNTKNIAVDLNPVFFGDTKALRTLDGGSSTSGSIESYTVSLSSSNTTPCGQISTCDILDPNGNFNVQLGGTIGGGNNNPFTINANLSPKSTTLPISLISFNAKVANQQVILDWSTGTEQDAKYFTVSRSADAKNWLEVGRVAAIGNSTTQQNYSLTDKQPLAGANYYQLSETDLDGQTKVYKVIMANVKASNQVTVAPNPVKNIVRISGLPADQKIELLNIQGMRMTNFTVNNNDGSSITLNLEQLPAGIYILSAGAVKQRIVRL